MTPNVDSLWRPWTERSARVPFRESHKNVGNGERKIAAELGLSGIEMDTFDLLIGGERWEVKEILDSGSVFVGREGNKFAWKIRSQLFLATRELEEFYHDTLIGWDDVDLAGLDIDYLHFYMERISPSILEDGEIGPKAIQHSVRAFGIYREYLYKTCNLTGAAHRYVRCPELIQREWQDAASPSQIFKKIRGIVLVDEAKGFCLVPQDQLDRYLEFRKISKGFVKIGLRMSPEGQQSLRFPPYPIISRVREPEPLVISPADLPHQLKLLDPKPKVRPDSVRRYKNMARKGEAASWWLAKKG